MPPLREVPGPLREGQRPAGWRNFPASILSRPRQVVGSIISSSPDCCVLGRNGGFPPGGEDYFPVGLRRSRVSVKKEKTHRAVLTCPIAKQIVRLWVVPEQH